MPNIMGTNVAAPIVPFSTADLYPTHEAQYGLGGWRSVANAAALNAISQERQEVGMVVFEQDNSTYWLLTVVGTPPTYTQLTLGGTPGGSSGDIQYNNSGAFGGSATTINAAGSITMPDGQTLGDSAGNTIEFLASAFVLLRSVAGDNIAVGGGQTGVTDAAGDFLLLGGGTNNWEIASNGGAATIKQTTGGSVIAFHGSEFTFDSGIVLNGATGGNEGSGTLNATGLYINGVPVTAGGTPGGSSGTIQFNNSGSFGGASNSSVSGTGAVVLGNASNGSPTSSTALTVSASGNIATSATDWYSSNEGTVVAQMLTSGLLISNGVHIISNVSIGGSPALSVTGGVAASPDIADFITSGSTKAVWIDFSGNLNLAEGLYDHTGSPGSSGYVLSSTGSQVAWIPSSSGSGTVTSVAQTFTGGLISVSGSPITTSGTLALTVAGTSGGIPYFSSTSAWASSALLASGGLVIGGGAGTAPLTNTQLTFSAPTLTVGLAGTSSGILALTGSTSGSATFTAPAVAGTTSNSITCSNFFTAQGLVATAAGAASAPSVSITGAPYTGGSGTTTYPLVYINSGAAPTGLTTNGTMLGINAPSGFTGYFVDFHLNGGNSLFSVSAGGTTSTGNLIMGASSTATFFGRSIVSSPSNGTILLTNNAATAFTALEFGGTTSSFVSLQSSGTTLTVGTGSSGGAGNLAIGGTLTNYNQIATVANGVPSEYATVNSTGNTANIASTTLYAVPAAGAGFYRVSAYIVETTAATTSSVLPSVVLGWKDETGTTQSSTIVAGGSTSNAIGTFASGSFVIYSEASQNITYSTTGYTSVGGTSMAFSLRIRMEAMG